MNRQRESLQIPLHFRTKSRASCTGAPDDSFGSGNTPGIGLRSPGKNSESVGMEEETSLDSLNLEAKTQIKTSDTPAAETNWSEEIAVKF